MGYLNVCVQKKILRGGSRGKRHTCLKGGPPSMRDLLLDGGPSNLAPVELEVPQGGREPKPSEYQSLKHEGGCNTPKNPCGNIEEERLKRNRGSALEFANIDGRTKDEVRRAWTFGVGRKLLVRKGLEKRMKAPRGSFFNQSGRAGRTACERHDLPPHPVFNRKKGFREKK